MKEKSFFIGIDLGWKEKKTTGVCVLENQKIVLLKDIFGKDLFKTISPYLKNTKVIGIDAPLTKGAGKGRMRLFEKFLSTSIFRKEKANPKPPALMPEFHNFSLEVAEKLQDRGFSLGINLIETFLILVNKISKEKTFFKYSLAKTENQRSALICSQIAFLHSQFKTSFLGYRDGFLFLPEMLFWKKEWKKKFFQAWQKKSHLKYHYLVTNLFSVTKTPPR